MANFYLITVYLIGGGTKRFEGRLNTLAGPDKDGRKRFQKLCNTLTEAENIGIIDGWSVDYES